MRQRDRVQQAGAGTEGRPGARLAQVVDAAPQELAGVLRVVAHGGPLVAVVCVLRADDAARRLVRVGLQNLQRAIVLPHHIQQVGQPVLVVVARVRPEERLRHRPRRIVLVEGGHQRLQDRDRNLRTRRVVDLVARRPQNNAGMVAVAHHRVGGVADVPFLEVEVVVVWVLGHRPAVEHLVHDEEAHAVGQIQKLRRGRVVRRADGVRTDLAQLGQPPLHTASGTAVPSAPPSVCSATPRTL